jgi:hypothetical protein
MFRHFFRPEVTLEDVENIFQHIEHGFYAGSETIDIIPIFSNLPILQKVVIWLATQNQSVSENRYNV